MFQLTVKECRLSKSVLSGLEKELVFVEGNNDYIYARIHNYGDYKTGGTLNIHSVNIKKVIGKTVSDIFLTELIGAVYRNMFDVKEDDELGNHLSSSAATATLSIIKGQNTRGVTRDVVIGEITSLLQVIIRVWRFR